MAAMSIQLSDELQTRLRARAAESGFDSVEAYIEAMVRADAMGGPVMDETQLESLLRSRMNGPFVETNAADFQQMREKLQKRLDEGER